MPRVSLGGGVTPRRTRPPPGPAADRTPYRATVSNSDTDAARTYHDGSKHPDGFLMSRQHHFYPRSQPVPFKLFREVETVPLGLDLAPRGVPALAAIGGAVEPGGEMVPDLSALGRVLYFSAGITKTIGYPFGEISFRAAACTGALYHIELYLVCGDLPGLEAGVYHFDPASNALDVMRRGDFRGALVEASGGESSVARAPAVLAFTDVFWRNACKYQVREYRHAYWDSGTIISNTLAMSYVEGMSAGVVTGFVDEAVNRLLDLDARREVAVALVPIGAGREVDGAAAPPIGPLSLETVPISDRELDFPPIREMHDASSLRRGVEVAEWRGGPSSAPAPQSREPGPPPSDEAGELFREPLESVIRRRGSTRRFAREEISFAQLSMALHQATAPLRADFRRPDGQALNGVYLIVNAVDGLTPGSYYYDSARGGLEVLEEGDFRGMAGYLGLHQELPADASVDVFFMADLESALSAMGNRGYRCAQFEASIAAGRMYLAAYAQRFGATGLTFYDDAVTTFFSPHAQGKSAMFMVALGKRAPRRRQ